MRTRPARAICPKAWTSPAGIDRRRAGSKRRSPNASPGCARSMTRPTTDAVAVAFVVLFFVAAFRLLPEREARTSIVLFLALPVSGTVFYWVGQDAVTSLLMLLGVLSARRPLVTVVVGIALGMQHFVQGFAA